MSLWHCTGCSAARSVGLPVCPQCGGTEYIPEPLPPGAYACETPGCGGAWRLQLLSCPRCGGTVSPRLEEPMPHITVHGGPSDRPEEPAHAAVEEPAAVVDPPEDDHPGEAGAGPEEAAGAGDAADEDVPERPADTAAKGRWVEYTVARGLDQDTAKGMTRAQLQAWEPPTEGERVEVAAVAEAEVVHPDGSRS